MTDNETIKALENIANEKIGCCKEDCNFYDGKVHGCAQTIAKHSLDLINRQKAEIERLSTKEENLRCVIEDLSNNTEHIKAEAIKEFAERLKEKRKHAYSITGDDWYEIDTHIINNLVKEMVGED